MKHSIKQIVTTALVGTGRQSLRLDLADNQLGEVLKHLDHTEKETELLSAVSAYALYECAGKISKVQKQSLPEKSEIENLPVCSLLSGQHLALILSGNAQLLPEWLRVAFGKRVPPQYLPHLLTLGKKQSHLRAAILPVLGKRGYWLAMHNPEWNYVNSKNNDKAWQSGSKENSKLLLQRLREQEPHLAREKLEASWKKENGEERANLLAALEVNLSMNDEPFLEAALDDKRKQVRDVASLLLSKLPESRLCQRMITRVFPLLQLNHNRVKVTLPTKCDRSMIRDGIDQSRYSSALGEKATLLLQMLGCVPPSFLCHIWQKTPKELVQAVDGIEWEKMLLEGFAYSACKTQDVAWAEVLLPVSSKFYDAFLGKGEELVVGLLKVLGQDKANALILQTLLPHQSKLLNLKHPAYILLKHYQMPWSGEISEIVLSSIGKYIEASNQSEWGVRSHFQSFALYMQPSIIDAAAELLVVENSFWQDFVDEFLATLLFRFEMIQELLSE